MPAICPPDRDRNELDEEPELPCNDPEEVDEGATLEVLDGSADEEDVVVLAFGLGVKPQIVASVIAVLSATASSAPTAEHPSP
jgi:hypothetical protein